MARYKLFRKLANGNWKYADTYNSTLDPNYHAVINYLNDYKIDWELRDSDGKIKFSKTNEKED